MVILYNFNNIILIIILILGREGHRNYKLNIFLLFGVKKDEHSTLLNGRADLVDVKRKISKFGIYLERR